MRIVRLDLLAFGPFTDVALDFSAGRTDLHLVYGPNEAGKSSALRALHQLLYGIPNNSPDNFIHAHRDLRIGAVLESAVQTRLECLRRKGRKDTLLDPSALTPLDPQLLSDLLCGIDEQSFRHRFGIDYESLVQGGRALVQGGGELGRTLFAAAAGIADLGRVQRELLAQADDLYRPSGKVRVVNKALAELALKQQEVRQARLPSQKWQEAQRALDEATAQKVQLQQQVVQCAAQLRRLERIDQALPLIVQYRQTREELAELTDAALLPDGFVEQRWQAQKDLELSRRRDEETRRELAEIDEALARLDLPDVLLRDAEIIEQLHQRSGSYLKARQDLPGLVARRQQLEAEARSLLRDELRRSVGLEEAAGLRLSGNERLRIQQLGNERQMLIARLETAREQVDHVQASRQRLTAQLNETPAVADAAPLRLALRRAQEQGPLEGQLQAARQQLAELERRFGIELRKLPLWSGSADQLEALPVPDLDSIEHFGWELSETWADVRERQGRVDDVSNELHQAQAELAQLERQQDIPDQVDLDEARQQRDRGWELVRHAWEDDGQEDQGQQVAEFVADYESSGNLADAYEQSVQQADDLADRLRSDAEWVTRRDSLVAECQKLTDRQEQLTQRLEDVQAAHQESQRKWEALWAEAGIVPRAPREMRGWLSQYQALLGSQGAMRQERQTIAQLQSLMDLHRQELQAALCDFDQDAGIAAGLGPLLARAQACADRFDELHRQRVLLEQQLEQLERQWPQVSLQSEQAEAALTAWRVQWQQWMQRLALPAEATPPEAQLVLDQLDALLAKLREASDLEERISGIGNDSRQFETAALQLAGKLAPDLSGLPADQVISRLNARLNQARQQQAQRQALERRRAAEVKRCKEVEQSQAAAEALLRALCRSAACQTPEQLPQAEQRSQRRRTLQELLAQLEQQLFTLAAGSTLDAFLDEAGTTDADQLPARISQLEAQLTELRHRQEQLDQAIGDMTGQLQRMDGSSRAAEAQEEVQALIARIGGDVQRYVQARLAAIVLGDAIEQYRQHNQGQVLQRASEMFAELTLGSFEGLRADCSDTGQPILVGVRPGGRQTVRVEGMSEGTCDQLYLALRLASLEEHLDRHQPMPFIVDDVLIKFDDARAVAALKALARLSERTQIILFTHHEHMLELARTSLDDDAWSLHGLGEFPAELHVA